MKGDRKKVGDMLVEAGIINDLQRSAALGEQKQWGGKFGSILIRMGFIDEKSAAAVLERQLGQKCVTLKTKEIPANVLAMVRPNIARKYNIIPIDFNRRTLSVAISDPNDLVTIDDLSFILGMNIKPVLALEYEIKNAIAQYYH